MQPFKHYTFIDYLTQGYIALVGLLVFLFHGRSVTIWPQLVAAHILVFGLVHLLIKTHARDESNRVLRFLRHFYPILLYTGFYRETGVLNQMFVEGYLDPFFIRIEQTLFGFQPSLELMGLLPYRWAAELIYAAYFSYYVMISGIGLALYLRQRNAFAHYIAIVSFVFYLCYLTYICVPVIGPRLFYRPVGGYQLPPETIPGAVPPIPDSVKTSFFYKIMEIIYDIFESPGAAFPSSHVAVAICTLYFTFRYLPRIRWVHTVSVLLLCFSTVYGKYHYAVDVFAGALTAAVLIPIGNVLYARFGVGPQALGRVSSEPTQSGKS